ncbi:phosphotransferase-like protein [Streptomyces sp. DSM 118148]|uniref:phosphotransferase-like protein n=1 Tax=Streptomyces sp. DSM 118148 TaxID=3448667 RepID=UPI00404013CA
MSGKHGVVLYGPPAAGKDTVTRALTELNLQYTQFARLKIGSGKSSGYRMGTAEQLHTLEEAGDVVYANARYGNTYVIDRPGLNAAFEAGVPVVHLGQVDGIQALVEGYPADWALVLLWCSRDETARRSEGRGDADTTARMAAWDATREDLDMHAAMTWNLRLDTTTASPQESARRIDQLLAQRAEATTS